MRKTLCVLAVLLLSSGALFLLMSGGRQPPALIDVLYKDASLPVEERVESLLSQMTLDEKIGQMALVEKNSVTEIRDVGEYGLGGLLSGGGAHPERNTPEGWLEMVGGFVDASRSSRLGIPVLYGIDAIHGHSNIPTATIFPHAIGLGAAGDAELVEDVARATTLEVAATGIVWTFSPNLDAPQDIRWGRAYEAFSSDAQTDADLGAAYIRGVQGAAADAPVALATAKHYLGAGGMRWGSTVDTDYRIDQGTTPADEDALREFYLPPFQAAVDAGVLSVMAGLNTYGDQRISANAYLLTDVLKGELGFKGFVVSDWYGVYALPEWKYDATVTAVNAGVDMLMLPFDYRVFINNVGIAVRIGDISEERIDDAVRRILRAKFAVGLFEEAPSSSLDVIGSDEHRALAREAVSRSLVLLKNEDETVPVSSGAGRILVAGSAADNTGRQSGAWTIDWQGVDGNVLPGATSVLAGIREVAGSDARIEYDAAARFGTDGGLADVGIAVVGEKPYAEGMGDNENPTLTAEDLAVISSLERASKKVIVVIVSGRPLLLPAAADQWDAIIAAWLPGSEGGGVADALFGKKSFEGTLPLPWPARLSQLPFSPDGISADGTAPLFPRGFGL